MRNLNNIQLSGILFALCWLVPIISTGQDAAVYNINKYNGLSTNHVYCALVDKLGYLWLGTTEGVYRYNGYSLRKYDYKDGLPNKDVWGMYQDKSGKLWLRSIAQQFGYIKNNKFYRVYKNTRSRNFEIYPTGIKETGDGITFINAVSDTVGYWALCLVQNDTLNIQYIRDEPNLVYVPLLFGDTVLRIEFSAVNVYARKKFNTDYNRNISPDRIIKLDYNIYNLLQKEPAGYTYCEKYYAFYQKGGICINFLDIKTGKIKVVDIAQLLKDRDERILFCLEIEQGLSCIAKNSVALFDQNAEVTYVASIDSLFPMVSLEGFSANFFNISDTWGKILCTNRQGTFIHLNSQGYTIEHTRTDLSDFKFINRINDTDGYWWSGKDHILAVVNKGEIKKTIHLPHLLSINKIVGFDSNRSIIATDIQNLWMYKDGTTEILTKNINRIITDTPYALEIDPANFWSAKDIFVTSDNALYIAGSSVAGTMRVHIDESRGIMHHHIVDPNRFKHIVFASELDLFIYYSSDKVCLSDSRDNYHAILNQGTLETLGIKTIEKIIPDSHGNIFIKDYDGIKVVNWHKRTIRPLLNTFNLERSVMDILGDTLLVAGSFGILKAHIHRDGTIAVTHTFQNTKSLYYKYLNDIQFAAGHALLSTDSGTYIYYYPKSGPEAEKNDFRIIAGYEDTLFHLHLQDTLTISQPTNTIDLDVIKPTGTGTVNILYSLNNSSYIPSGGQLMLHGLSPGSYNTISLIVSDDSWRSKPLKFTIYIQPKWWQTLTAKRIIFVLSLLAFIGFVYLVIVMTRRIVNKNNERRNQRRELELKSIYSQINPHFIFNSLSTAQYFVKKNKNKEAFEHINQFSDLLRSYIKSSRAKYITIAEEIENLENYLHLQLTRFEEKFDYTIEVDKSVDATKVKIPSLLLQPLVENALNHGIFHSDAKGRLLISFKIDEHDKDTLICIVDDNGIGRQKSKELRSKIIRKADSYGTILIKELIDTFNKYEKINIEIEYIDKQLPLTGTTVVIRIKNFAHAQ